MTNVAVIDIGKTNAKLALVDTRSMSEIAVVTRPNTVLPGPPWPHFDVEGHWTFLLDGLAAFHREHDVSAISVTTHGACGVLLDSAGDLAAPVLDYEFGGPETMTRTYDAIRPGFEETGSPRLPAGLNLGAQLFWMFQTDPALNERTSTFLTYPQYWGYRLTGVAASDVSSLGCHTDLWNPYKRHFSSLVDRLGLSRKMAPARPASDVLGTILPEVANSTGLPAETPVHCGIHDSNASLLPHILQRATPFSVISTGTWVIAMSVGGAIGKLDPARDTLVNVNAFGDPVPSARFMGGREFETMLPGQKAVPEGRDIGHVLDTKVMLLPSVVSGSGPYPGDKARWQGEEPRHGTGARTVAASFYLAMMTAKCLELIGHQGMVVVEGPFAGNREFCRMLSAATACPVVPAENTTGTSHGAALLAVAHAVPQSGEGERRICEEEPAFLDYARAWNRSVANRMPT